MALRWIWAGLALAGVAACDDAAFEDEMTFAEMVEANGEMAERVADLPETRAADMPVTGSAVFDGYTGLTMQTERRTDLVGTATLTADFEEASIAGSLEDFRGRVNGGDVQDLDGALSVSGGAIGIATASGFGADLQGVLTGRESGVVGVDGSIFGNFRSEDGRGAQALTAVTAGGTDFTLNGTERGGILTIVAER